MKLQQIKEKNPFSDVIGNITDIKSIHDDTATTGNVFKVTNETGECFKITVYNNIEKAKRVESNIRPALDLLPSFLGRKDNFLCFNWIKGEQLKYFSNIRHCFLLGGLYGKIHSLNKCKDKSPKIKLNSYFDKLVKTDVFDKDFLSRVKEDFESFYHVLEDRYVLEINDANPANFLAVDDDLVVVDEECVNYNIRGRGLYGALKTMSAEGKEKFWEGYIQHSDASLFTQDYLEFLDLLSLVISCQHRIHKYGLDDSKSKESISALKEHYR